MGSERPDLGSEKARFGFERTELGTDRLELGSGRPDLRSDMRVFPLFDSITSTDRPTDQPTDRPTDKASYKVACLQLKRITKMKEDRGHYLIPQNGNFQNCKLTKIISPIQLPSHSKVFLIAETSFHQNFSFGTSQDSLSEKLHKFCCPEENYNQEA